MVGLHLFMFVLLMVSGSLLAKTDMAYHALFICENKNTLGKDAHCYQLKIGLVNISILYFMAWQHIIDFCRSQYIDVFCQHLEINSRFS